MHPSSATRPASLEGRGWGRSVRPSLRPARGLAVVGLCGVAVFVGVAALLPYRQTPGYSQVHDAVSVLVLGREGWLLTMAFCALGLGTIAVAAALQWAVPTRAAAGMLAVSGLLDFVAAAFPTVRADDAVTPSSIVHNLTGLVTFLLTITAMVLYGRAFVGRPAWQSLARPAWLLAAASFVFLAIAFAVLSWFGLLERLMLATQFTWMVLVALRTRAVPSVAADGGAPKGSPGAGTPAR